MEGIGRVRVISSHSILSGGNTGWVFANTPGTVVSGTDDMEKASVRFDWAYMRDPNTGHYEAVGSVTTVVLKSDLAAA